MFQITTPTEAHVASVTNRTEAHGEDRVPAVSIGLEITAANTMLDMLDPKLREALYKPVDGQEQLPGIEPSTPVLRCNSVDHVVLTTAHEGWTLTVDDGIDDTTPMTFGSCKVDKVKVEAKQGGSIVLRLRVGTSDIDADRLGKLGMHNGASIWITCRPPEKAPDAIDGTTEAFKRDHPGGGAQADLLGDDGEDAGDAFAAAHGPEDDPAEPDGEGDQPDAEHGGNWPFPEDGSQVDSEVSLTGTSGGESFEPETKPARGRRSRKAAEVE
jgi:hypothetical protein